MHRIGATLILIGALALASGSASGHVRVTLLGHHAAVAAAVQGIRIVDRVGIPTKTLRRIESALVVQVNRQVRPVWHTPPVRFSAAGWQVTVIPVAEVLSGDAGYHGYDDGSGPFAVVGWDGSTEDLAAMLSHELIEMLANPDTTAVLGGYAKEICDPVSYDGYMVDGIPVADFVTPAWFLGGPGPYDMMREAPRAGSTLGGYIERVAPDGTGTDQYGEVVPGR